MEETSLFTAKGYLHGGARKGAGRPKTSRKEVHSIRCTPEEWKAVLDLLDELRAGADEGGGGSAEGE